MNLYIKILGFIKPYWKSILLSLLCTFLYVFFNNLSLWISGDFVQELFSPDYVNETVSIDQDVDPGTSIKELKLEKLFDLSSDFDLYTTIDYHIKRFLIQDTRADTLKMVCFIILLAFIFKNIVDYLRKVILNFVEVRVVMNIRNRLHERLMHLPIPYFEKHHSGKLTSIVFNDVTAINNVLHTVLGT